MPGDPAARLRLALESFRAASNAEPHQATAVVWAKSLGLSWPEDMAQFFAGAAEIVQLSARARRLVEELADDPDVYLRHYSQVEGVLSNFYNLSQQSNTFLGGMDQAGWHSLELASSVLRRKAPDPNLPQNKLDGFADEVHNLLDDLAVSTDIPLAEKSWLDARLRDVEQALLDINLIGTPGLANKVDQLAGSVVRRGMHLPWRTSDVLQAIGKFIVAVDLALNVAANVQALTAGSDEQPAPPQQTTVIQQFFYEQGVTRAALPPSDAQNGH